LNLEKLFSSFLVQEKGFPEGCLLFEASLHPKVDEGSFRRYIADLLILDTEFNNYLALVEFKAQGDKRNVSIAYEQVRAYLNVLNKPDLPSFLVVPREENDFEIYQLSTHDWARIEKEDFPQFQTLQSKAQADSKTLYEDLNERKYREAKRRKELLRGAAWSTLLSLLAGIIAVVIFSIDTFKNGFGNSVDKETCCDSTSLLLNKLSVKLNLLDSQFKNLKNSDTLIKSYFQGQKLNAIEQRIDSFERSVTSSPDKLLKLQEINFQFHELQALIAKEKEISDIKISNLREKLDQVTIWTSGLIITIIGSIIGFAINAFRKS